MLRCIDCKRGVVERDEREAGARKLLQFRSHPGSRLWSAIIYYRGPHPWLRCGGKDGLITAASEARGPDGPLLARRLLRVLKRYGLPADDPANNAALLPAYPWTKAGRCVSDLVILREIRDACVYRLPLLPWRPFWPRESPLDQEAITHERCHFFLCRPPGGFPPTSSRGPPRPDCCGAGGEGTIQDLPQSADIEATRRAVSGLGVCVEDIRKGFPCPV